MTTVAGIDIGSLTAKAVIMIDGRIAGRALILTGPDSAETSIRVMNLALTQSGSSLRDIEYIVATGYGRIIVPYATETITEISCHATGSHWLFHDVRTILDMGGQDCKAIRCNEKGKVINFVMNDKCAAGTGRYLERIATTLELPLDSIGPMSLEMVERPLPINSFCTVFATSDIINLVREGARVNDVLAGAFEAIVSRIHSLLDKVGVEPELSISGGVAKNIGVVRRLEEQLGLRSRIFSEPQIVGALGAAVIATDRVKQNHTTLRKSMLKL